MSARQAEPKSIEKRSKKVHPIRELKTFLFELIDLKEGIDVEGTIYEVRNNNRMQY